MALQTKWENEWRCPQCGAIYPEAIAYVLNFTCENPCLTTLVDSNGDQHCNPEDILPSEY